MRLDETDSALACREDALNLAEALANRTRDLATDSSTTWTATVNTLSHLIEGGVLLDSEYVALHNSHSYFSFTHACSTQPTEATVAKHKLRDCPHQ